MILLFHKLYLSVGNGIKLLVPMIESVVRVFDKWKLLNCSIVVFSFFFLIFWSVVRVFDQWKLGGSSKFTVKL